MNIDVNSQIDSKDNLDQNEVRCRQVTWNCFRHCTIGGEPVVHWSTGAVVENPLCFVSRGRALPMVADRIDRFGRPGKEPGLLLHDATEQFDKLYFDTANAANPPALAALRAFANPGRILFGTGYPHVPLARGADDLARAEMTSPQRKAIEHTMLCY